MPYLGKLIKRTSVHRLSGHIKSNGLDEILQSAYKEWYSVETALLKVYDGLLCATDITMHILITLLDFSATFDTVEHDILFWTKEHYCGVSGAALD